AEDARVGTIYNGARGLQMEVHCARIHEKRIDAEIVRTGTAAGRLVFVVVVPRYRAVGSQVHVSAVENVVSDIELSAEAAAVHEIMHARVSRVAAVVVEVHRNPTHRSARSLKPEASVAGRGTIGDVLLVGAGLHECRILFGVKSIAVAARVDLSI